MTKFRLRFFGFILLLLATGVSIPRAESGDRDINVAAAADLSSALQEIGASYEKSAPASW